MTLPLALRNRLADLILDALHDADARRGLEALAAVCADPRALDPTAAPPRAFPVELFERRDDGWRLKSGQRRYAGPLGERASRAARALAGRPLVAADAPLEVALGEAAALFEAGLYFEVHELLEPHWMRAEGAARRSLQGLIQIAVGFQHLANGNMDGALVLLAEGAAKLGDGRLGRRALPPFARAVLACRDTIASLGADAGERFDWSTVPRFPAEA